jgi:hypothetical protein
MTMHMHITAVNGRDRNADALAAFDYLDSGPFCMVVLEQRGQDEYFTAQQINDTFEKHLRPLSKLTGVNFLTLVSEEHRQALLAAIDSAKNSKCQHLARARNVEMTTLTESNSGLPIKRRFDWMVGTGKDGQLLLFGDPCSDENICMEQRDKFAQVIDLFNAPVAVEGSPIVLCANANQTELDITTRRKKPDVWSFLTFGLVLIGGMTYCHLQSSLQLLLQDTETAIAVHSQIKIKLQFAEKNLQALSREVREVAATVTMLEKQRE